MIVFMPSVEVFGEEQKTHIFLDKKRDIGCFIESTSLLAIT